jgi:xanthine/uracil/vitamin C permease (AzgA family)
MAAVGLLVIALLMVRRVPGAIVLGIAADTTLALVLASRDSPRPAGSPRRTSRRWVPPTCAAR